MAEQRAGFEQLTWEDLTSWAGAKILTRGKSYKRQVVDLRRTSDGGIFAWVHGTQRYVTLVQRESSGRLLAVCSCPYDWSPCKHSVAVVLTYLDSVKNKLDVPQASKSDRRLKLIKDLSSRKITDTTWEEDEDDNNEEDFHESAQGSAVKHAMSVGRSRSARTRNNKREDVVRQRIESMDKGQLVEFVLNLVKEYSEIGRRIEEEEALREGRISKIVRSIRAEIEDLTSEPAWANYWSGEGSIPDYSGVRKRLQALLDSGHADEVVKLGEDLWRLGNEQVGSSDDEGETGSQISECIDVILQGVTKSSLFPRDQILWIIDIHLSDEYDLLDGSENYLAKLKDKQAWSEAADSLLERLERLPAAQMKTDFSTGYRRKRIMNWAIEALQRCGRRKDIIPLLEREAPITQCYGNLVEHLLSAKRTIDAKSVATHGFHQTIDGAPGIAWDLESKLLRMAELEKDLPLVAAYRSLEFFNRPSLDSYKTLRKAAEDSGQWPGVREAARTFLETGTRPDLEGSDKRNPVKSKVAEVWPLPSTEISAASAKAGRHYFPETSTLIRIAIHEKDTDEVIRRYDLAKNSRFFDGSVCNEVAEAVKQSHPNVSLEIWKNLAEEQIRLVKPAAYEVAARYLRKMRDIYQKTDRTAEWTALVKGIRAVHKPKRSLMQILDTLERKRILDS